MTKDGGLLTPLNLPHPMPKVEGDKRDIHDQNPHETAPHDKGPDTLPVVMYEGVEQGTKIGPVSDVAEDILSTAMGGQRRSATGEYESESSIHRTQKQELEELEERMRHPDPGPHIQKGRE